MPRPIPLAIRHTIITLRQRGFSQPEIASKTGVSLSSTKSIIKRFNAQGKEGLKPRYNRCGQGGFRTSALLVRQYLAMRKWHPAWGFDKISSLILAKYADIKLPDRRTVYRWWRKKGLIQPKSRPPAGEKQWAKAPHEVWQIDAKELMQIQSTQQQSWLNIVDEFTGAVVDPPVFPPWKNL